MHKHMPTYLYIHFPVFLMVAFIAAVNILPAGPVQELWLASEYGVVENLTVLFSLMGVFYAYKLMANSKALPQPKFFKAWFFLFFIALIYLAGEEASWGQHIFQWETGAYMMEHNSMGETNLHNLNNAMEQLPKILLHLAAFFGGLIWPLVVYLKNIKLKKDNFFYWLMPNYTVVLACLFAFGTRLWERYYVWMNIRPEYVERDAYKELKEANETFLALFILIYLLSVYYRVKESKKA